jgi:CRISPR-associated endonuclease/helicase Cas3
LRGWTGLQREPLRRLAELVDASRTLFSDAFADRARRLPEASAFQHLFAGLLMLADWLSSADGVDRFPFAERGDPSRADFVRARAPEVLARIGFIPPPAPRPFPTFTAQFPGFSPRAAQRAMDSLPLPDERGSVVLLESETGSGKTEAAFRWASRLIDAQLIDGCFFAVPLRSAAVQLHGRMQAWLDATYGEGAAEALLAVPDYRMGQAEGRKLPDFSVQWSDAETADRRSRRWAAEQPKRYAATSFAVGTIDQALLGTLAVRHAHLRAACLVRHLLVIDEVHSSDVYVTTLTERLLALFRAAGGHALLMSATVGAGTRARLVTQVKRSPAFADAVAAAYPRITASYAPAVDVESEGRAKAVRIEPCAVLDDSGRSRRGQRRPLPTVLECSSCATWSTPRSQRKRRSRRCCQSTTTRLCSGSVRLRRCITAASPQRTAGD